MSAALVRRARRVASIVEHARQNADPALVARWDEVAGPCDECGYHATHDVECSRHPANFSPEGREA